MRYWWEIPYILAILQTDEPSMHNALFEAIAAMEQRRMTPGKRHRRNCIGGSRSRITTAHKGNDREVCLTFGKGGNRLAPATFESPGAQRRRKQSINLPP
jgi:hypothetical protein